MQEYIKKILGSGKCPLDLVLWNNITTLIISNDEMKGIIEIVKSLEHSGLLLKVSETIQMNLKNKKEDFLVCYLVQWVQIYQEIF